MFLPQPHQRNFAGSGEDVAPSRCQPRGSGEPPAHGAVAAGEAAGSRPSRTAPHAYLSICTAAAAPALKSPCSVFLADGLNAGFPGQGGCAAKSFCRWGRRSIQKFRLFPVPGVSILPARGWAPPTKPPAKLPGDLGGGAPLLGKPSQHHGAGSVGLTRPHGAKHNVLLLLALCC